MIRVALIAALLILIADAHAGHITPDLLEVMQAYGWGNAPEWLNWYCAGTGRTDCWT